MNVAIPLITSVISLVFALTVLDQFLERKRPYQAAWTAGLLLYATASLLQALWGMGVYGEVVFRLWYWTGGMLVAAYLGMGSLYLHVPRKVGHTTLAVLLALTVLSVFLSLGVKLQGDVSLLEGGGLASVVPGTESGRYYPAYVGILTAVLNILGSLALVGSAVYSAISFARKKAAGYRVLSNALIAGGAFFSAAGGTLERFNLPESHSLALLVGVVLIYAGFLRSREVFEVYRIPFVRKAKEAGRG
ncbi:MAG: hypothetical protein HY533_06680 [Chloroflexi bacterium]|nr:hypothetical protein [Chloroflexota bacterium]